jgi:shikimate dehydrogenase
MSRFALLGNPVAHSLSPLMHAAAYEALGLPHTYEAILTTEAELKDRVDELRVGDFGGLNITAPYKRRALELADEVDEVAQQAGAANTLVLRRGKVIAFDTDVTAIAERVAQFFGAPPRDRALVIGSGGGARGAVAALVGLGIREVAVRAREVPDDFPPQAKREPFEANEALDKKTTIIVQCTSAGMTGADPGDIVAKVVTWNVLPQNAVAIDMVYSPPETPFIQAARKHQVRCEPGFEMLVSQGALALELWTGLVAPRDAMRAAVMQKLT